MIQNTMCILKFPTSGGPVAQKLAKMKRGQTSILQTGGEDSCQNVSFWVDGSRLGMQPAAKSWDS